MSGQLRRLPEEDERAELGGGSRRVMNGWKAKEKIEEE